MIISSNLADLGLTRATCLTIGNFDGSHLGHQALISAGLEIASKNSLDFCLITFWPHPRQYLRGSMEHKALTGKDEKYRLLANLGIPCILEIPFNETFAALSPQQFLTDWILPLKPLHVIVGHDFTFGNKRSGNYQLLKDFGQSNGFETSQISALTVGGETVSSSRLRQCIARGNVEEAAVLLGRPYSLSGIVEHGFGRGREIGFRTANLNCGDTLLPANGVYATLVYDEEKSWPAVTNIGSNPTFNGQKITIESFILDDNPDLYTKNLRLEFIARIRTERKFDSVSALTAQIRQDIQAARKLLAHNLVQ